MNELQVEPSGSKDFAREGGRARDPAIGWAARSGEEAEGTLRKLALDLRALGRPRGE